MDNIAAANGSTRIAIVYHSGFGHTRRQAEAVGAGVREVDGVDALLLPVEIVERHWDDLKAAQAIIFGAPPTWAPPLRRSKPLPKQRRGQ